MEQQSLRAVVSATGPRRWFFFHRSLEQRRLAVQELVRRAAADPAAERAVSIVWNRLLREQNGSLLGELARQAGQHKVASVACDLTKCFSLKCVSQRRGGST